MNSVSQREFELGIAFGYQYRIRIPHNDLREAAAEAKNLLSQGKDPWSENTVLCRLQKSNFELYTILRGALSVILEIKPLTIKHTRKRVA